MSTKTLLASLLLAVTTTSFAAERMNSLSYRVEARKLEIATGLNLTTEQEKDSSDDSKTKRKITQWDFDLNYGVSSELSVGLGFAIPVNTDLNVDGEDVDFKFVGLSDIALKSSYRYMNTDMKADLLVGLNISGKHEQKSKGNTTEYDFKSGGNSIEVGTKIASEMHSFEWGGLVNAKYNFERKFTDGTATYIDKTKAHADFKVGAIGQYNFMPTMSLAFNADVNLNGKEKSKVDGTGTKAFTNVGFGITYKYEIVEGLMFDLGYRTTLATDVKDLDGNVYSKDLKESDIGFNVTFRF